MFLTHLSLLLRAPPQYKWAEIYNRLRRGPQLRPTRRVRASRQPPHQTPEAKQCRPRHLRLRAKNLKTVTPEEAFKMLNVRAADWGAQRGTPARRLLEPLTDRPLGASPQRSRAARPPLLARPPPGPEPPLRRQDHPHCAHAHPSPPPPLPPLPPCRREAFRPIPIPAPLSTPPRIPPQDVRESQRFDRSRAEGAVNCPYFDVGVPPKNQAERIRQVSYFFLGLQARRRTIRRPAPRSPLWGRSAQRQEGEAWGGRRIPGSEGEESRRCRR